MKTIEIPSKSRIPGLDGLRAISIGIVFCAHAFGTRNLPSNPRLSRFCGDLGVRTFFLISGFLITSLLVNEVRKRGGISLKDFYVRRVYRIFPAFYVFLAVMIVVAALGGIVLSSSDALFAGTYTMNFHAERGWWLGHLWSLAVEEQFYLLWPLALCLAGLTRGRWIALGAICVAPVLRSIAYLTWPAARELSDQAFPFVCDSLATGCLLALLRDRLEASPRYARFLGSRWFWAVPLAGLAILAVPVPSFSTAVGVTVGNLAIALVIHRSVNHADGAWGRLLGSRAFTFVGALSYSLYLWQQPFLNRHADGLFQSFPLNLGCAFACALASYYLVERPMLALRERRARRPAAPREPSAPAEAASIAP